MANKASGILILKYEMFTYLKRALRYTHWISFLFEA